MPLPPVSRPLLLALVVSLATVLVATALFARRAFDATTPGPAGEPPSDPAPVTEPTTSGPTTTTTTTTTSTTVTPTTTTGPPTAHRAGDRGPAVLDLEQRLVDLGFWLPEPDGAYGSMTVQAVMAFQKANGLGRDGIAGPRTLEALETATPVVPRESGDHVEVDLERQIMLLVHEGETLVFNTSTGRPGWRTPPGRFTITRQIDGMRHAPLGDLWRPKYFNRGIAMHGSDHIPGHPASHGCTRLHHDVIDHIWERDLAPIGTTVLVY